MENSDQESGRNYVRRIRKTRSLASDEISAGPTPESNNHKLETDNRLHQTSPKYGQSHAPPDVLVVVSHDNTQ
ncbi:hypothetical protein RRG08_060015 [Elysia crispata]|uniref:Uncharacterized protein n=1 Tax=Elysia crispata TaxID=231223 RepID=A0AAE1CX52_9GAST|nr:hypothetical protein RRG08_060015 [Elysia crispata]